MPRYRLVLADGTVLGEAAYTVEVDVGDEIILHGNRRGRVSARIPTAVATEFVDGPLVDVLEVELVDPA
jgi:hypothetical protein